MEHTATNRIFQLNKIITESFDNADCCDFEFVFPDTGQTIRVVRSLAKLLSKSYLKGMLSSNWTKEDRIEMKTYTYPVFYQYLRYLHTGSLKVDDIEQAIAIYDLAKGCLEEELQKDSLSMIEKHIGVANCCKIYQFAIDHDLNELEKKALHYIADNFAQVSQTNGVDAMSESTLRKFFKDFGGTNKSENGQLQRPLNWYFSGNPNSFVQTSKFGKYK